jgi:hypothetical protein
LTCSTAAARLQGAVDLADALLDDVNGCIEGPPALVGRQQLLVGGHALGQIAAQLLEARFHRQQSPGGAHLVKQHGGPKSARPSGKP